MRWPLKYQIMVPMTVIMLGTVVGVSVFQAYLAAERMRDRTATRIRNVTNTLAGSTFPMTRAVLEQMKGLAGADFVLTDARGKIAASTRGDWQGADIARPEECANTAEFQLAEPMAINGERLFHAAIAVRPRGPSQRAGTLHVFYSEDVYLEQRRRATLPALGIGGIAIVMVVLLALLTAARVSRPLGQLREQVNRIAEGNFQPISLPRRNDEVRELSSAVNHMAEQLSQYEQQIRRTERIRLLAQLGSGLAHQLRNSATGARMALDIHRGECPTATSSESLGVATRQLVLMEKYLARFLSSAASQPPRLERLDFAQLVNNLLPLVQPAAQHTGVALHAEIPNEPLFIRGDSVALEHMVLNLLINAVEAAGRVPPERESRACDPRVHVNLRVHVNPRGDGAESIVLRVEDTGPGPPAEIITTMFEPFVTAKKDGVGLGLAIAREVVLDHEGQFSWERTRDPAPQQRKTRFIVEIPAAGKGNESANTARN